MAIIVEDGSIITGANSYVSEAELTAFLSARNITLSGDFTTEQLLLIAMDYIESLSYKGVKMRYDQPLQWPRADVYIDGYYNDVDNIPKELKNGLMQAAASIDAGNSPQQVAPRKTIMEKVEGIQVQYSEGSSAVPIDPKIMAFLYKLLGTGGAGAANTVGKKG
jgi:hypothetical protein